MAINFKKGGSIFIFFAASIILSGCSGVSQNTWKEMKFDSKGNQAKVICIENIEKASISPTLWIIGGGLSGLTAYNKKRSFELQDCMAVKGFDCVDDCAYEAIKK